MEKDNIKYNIAANIAYFRKELNLTQIELAKKLNYSDKSISKWERGEGTPDITVLVELCNFFNVTLNEIVSEKKGNEKQVKDVILKAKLRKRVAASYLYASLVWVTITIIFVFLNIIDNDLEDKWLLFIYAIPSSILVLLIFNICWLKKFSILLYSSLFTWGISLSFFLSFTFENNFSLFIVALTIQIALIIFFYIIRDNKVKSKI